MYDYVDDRLSFIEYDHSSCDSDWFRCNGFDECIQSVRWVIITQSVRRYVRIWFPNSL